MTDAIASVSETEALRQEIDLVRDDMVESLHRLREALSLRRAVQARPSVAVAVTVVGGALVVLAIRRSMRRRRPQQSRLRVYLPRGWR